MVTCKRCNGAKCEVAVLKVYSDTARAATAGARLPVRGAVEVERDRQEN